MTIVVTINGVTIVEDGTTDWTANGVQVSETTVAADGQPTMRRWGGIPHMRPGPVLAGRSW